MAEYNEIGDIVSDASRQKEACSDRLPSKKKMRFTPPEIDRNLLMKWGLALLGEDKSREYLAWLSEKMGQGDNQ